jgi:hypothetical protein
MKNYKPGLLNALFGTQSFLAVHRILIKKFGLETAAVLCELITKIDEYGVIYEGEKWFYYTLDRFAEIGVGRKKVEKIIRSFSEKGFLKTKNMGMPNKRHFALNEETLYDYIFMEEKPATPVCPKEQTGEKSDSQFVQKSKPVCPKEQTGLSESANQFVQKSKHLLDKSIIQDKLDKTITAEATDKAPLENWESLFLERIQKFSKEVKGEKLTRLGFGNPALLDIVTFCLESDNGITPLDMLERKLKAFKESQVPFIAENRSKFTLHLLRQVWDQLPIIESPQIAQNQSIGDFKLAKGVHLPEIEVTPEERQETLLKYGTFD